MQTIKNFRSQNRNSRIDWPIIAIVLSFFVIGMLSLYLALANDSVVSSIPRAMIMQIVWWLIGTAIIIVLMRLDSGQLSRLAPIVFYLSLFLLVMVRIFYDRTTAASTGAYSWFRLGPISFQPSEFAKPAYILFISNIITEHNRKYQVHSKASDWILLRRIGLWTLLVLALMLIQRDFGTMLVFMAIFAGMVVVSGVLSSILVPVALTTVGIGLSLILLVATGVGRRLLTVIGFQSYQFSRIDAWLNPAGDTSNAGYQLWQSMKAIGSGGLFGNGFDNVKVRVPVRESDMIFSIIGENFGFIGSILIIGLYLLLIYFMIQRVFDTKNQFYAYVSTGVIMMILFHVFENIGMSIGLLPLTGIPLPFISQGGSALVANLIGIGLVLSMRYHNRSGISFSNAQGFKID